MQRVFGVFVITCLAAGCGCLSTQQVRERQAKQYANNRIGAEPDMRAAAQARGAELLTIEPQFVAHRLPCAEGRDELAANSVRARDTCDFMAGRSPGCQRHGSDGRAFIIHTPGESPKLVIPIRNIEGASYARLARSDRGLFILLPHYTSKTEVSTMTQCTCDGMPRVHCASSYGFVVDVPEGDYRLEEAYVPMELEYEGVKCETIGL